jgi:hypothetical protein
MRTTNCEWPKIRKRVHQSGKTSWQVDCGKISGRRLRKDFPNKKPAKVYAAQMREQSAKEGQLAGQPEEEQSELVAGPASVARDVEPACGWG